MSEDLRLIIVAVIASSPGLYAIFSKRKSDHADTLAKYMAMTDDQADEIKKLRADLDRVLAERQVEKRFNARLVAYIDYLVGIIREENPSRVLEPRPVKEEVAA